MNYRISSVFLLLIVASVQSLECNVNSSQYPNAAKVGNSFVVCIHFAKSDGTGQRGVFPLVVDKYSALQLSGAYSLMDPSSKTTNTTITIQVQNSNITKQALFYNAGLKKVASMMSFIIYANNGIVQNIQDDNSAFCNGCSTCGSYVNNNNQTHQNCFVQTNSTSNNDPKIFISWMGTDSSQQYLLSQTHRIAKFTEYSMNNVFESALDMFQKI